MLDTLVDPRPRPSGPEAAITTVVVLFVTVLVLTGMKPATAVLVVGCAALVGAAVARACTTGRLTALLRPALVEVRATPI
ncbi:hypothetical protein [Streptomyces sp. SID10815]|uniref:hypothetical protein n=1 Tax=Streptomyces sp. SID10815 TaxID=2706027 RepID=UPI0013C8616A|nr:hypothetical protein [Streptomyces sp. SID10815]NEA46824.1 hypothetical protein [Streptomyces sp. SID10815]